MTIKSNERTQDNENGIPHRKIMMSQIHPSLLRNNYLNLLNETRITSVYVTLMMLRFY